MTGRIAGLLIMGALAMTIANREELLGSAIWADNPGLGALTTSFSFIQLVFESDAIAVGKVLGVGPEGPDGAPGQIILGVSESFHLALAQKVVVDLPVGGLDASPAFQTGESCILFLARATESRGTLIGTGDMGKWPRLSGNWLFTPGHVQPLEKVTAIIRAVLKVDRMMRYEQRAEALIQPPFIHNRLGRIAALQYGSYLERWPGDRLQGNADLKTVRAFLAVKTLLDDEPLDVMAEIEMIHQYLGDLPKSIACRKWIEALAHPDFGVRNTAATVLSAETGEDFGYDARADEAERAEAIDLWEDWLERRLPGYLQKEVPDLLAGLKSSVALERRTADLLLQIVSGQEIGFNAEDPESHRDAAILQWEQWWKNVQKAAPAGR